MPEDTKPITVTESQLRRISWSDFRADGMLWLVNRFLHLFGLAIVMEFDEDGVPCDVYPARTRFRGFTYEADEEGFRQVSRYLERMAPALAKEAEE